MDFRGRGNQNSTPGTQPVGHAATSSAFNSGNQISKFDGQQVSKLLQLGHVILLFAVTALVVALTFLLVLGGNAQQKAVNKKHFQAVFLNNGQVYFGSISSLSDKTLDLRNIYYLQTSGGTGTGTQATSATNVSLVKLGCELHAPYDQMLINRDQVIFWENLQDSSQVVQAIAKYKQDNSKQNCSQQSQSSTDQAPSTTPTTANPTTPVTAPTTKKP